MTVGIDMHGFRVSSLMAHFKQSWATPPSLPQLHSLRDDDFLARVETIVREHIGDPRFTTTVAATVLTISRMHLNRKLRALTGQSTHEFIRALRLDAARELLMRDSMSITVIASTVGFKSPSHFVEAFRDRFGATPARYRRLQRSLPASLPDSRTS